MHWFLFVCLFYFLFVLISNTIRNCLVFWKSITPLPNARSEAGCCARVKTFWRRKTFKSSQPWSCIYFIRTGLNLYAKPTLQQPFTETTHTRIHSFRTQHNKGRTSTNETGPHNTNEVNETLPFLIVPSLGRICLCTFDVKVTYIQQ